MLRHFETILSIKTVLCMCEVIFRMLTPYSREKTAHPRNVLFGGRGEDKDAIYSALLIRILPINRFNVRNLYL